jgi:hypothetical protein
MCVINCFWHVGLQAGYTVRMLVGDYRTWHEVEKCENYFLSAGIRKTSPFKK